MLSSLILLAVKLKKKNDKVYCDKDFFEQCGSTLQVVFKLESGELMQ